MKGAFFYFFLIMIAVAIMWSAFLFPYIARFENTVKQTLKNAFLLMIRHLPWALLLLVILVASVLSVYIIPVLLVVIPAVQKCMQHSYDRLKVDDPYCFLHVRIWSAVLP